MESLAPLVGAWGQRCHGWPHHSATLSGRDEVQGGKASSERESTLYWYGLIWIDRLIDWSLDRLLACLFASCQLAGCFLADGDIWFRTKATDINTGLAIHSHSLLFSGAERDQQHRCQKVDGSILAKIAGPPDQPVLTQRCRIMQSSPTTGWLKNGLNMHQAEICNVPRALTAEVVCMLLRNPWGSADELNLSALVLGHSSKHVTVEVHAGTPALHRDVKWTYYETLEIKPNIFHRFICFQSLCFSSLVANAKAMVAIFNAGDRARALKC